VVVAKTEVPDKRLPGTIYSAAEAIEKAGGRALAIATDIRSEEQVKVRGAVMRLACAHLRVLTVSAYTHMRACELRLLSPRPLRRLAESIFASTTRAPFI
jgi:hypothetical protein